jgi:hypothetical protein
VRFRGGVIVVIRLRYRERFVLGVQRSVSKPIRVNTFAQTGEHDVEESRGVVLGFVRVRNVVVGA